MNLIVYRQIEHTKWAQVGVGNSLFIAMRIITIDSGRERGKLNYKVMVETTDKTMSQVIATVFIDCDFI